MKSIDRLYAINEAIWIRDNAQVISRNVLIEKLQNLAEYDMYSNRQMANICGNVIRHNVIAGYVNKTNKTGGRLNPASLEDLREALFSKERGRIDYASVKNALEAGTSQGMVSKLTGINQSVISRRISNEK
ncbi:hypothetical protein UFOVP536_37 [uncultured Caudovirales phage]|uniref:Uncharacterized protein n=1 Tax=uncultured Caudovirales phage TaxID=2100421 RepID=A0A6J5MPA0_9CAUD|nr:hypothetical protein UFOVP536_37 [uncultured Caudovirales phage]